MKDRRASHPKSPPNGPTKENATNEATPIPPQQPRRLSRINESIHADEEYDHVSRLFSKRPSPRHAPSNVCPCYQLDFIEL
jgi:hypothetical protein